jgi:hypothetical protein
VTLKAIQSNIKFLDLMRQVKSYLLAASRRGDGEVVLGFFCESGRHRGPGCSESTRAILHGVGYAMGDNWHHSQGVGRWRRVCRQDCADCLTPESLRDHDYWPLMSVLVAAFQSL